MNEQDLAQGMPSLEQDLRLPEDLESSPAAVLAGALIASAANTAFALFGLLARGDEPEVDEDARAKEGGVGAERKAEPSTATRAEPRKTVRIELEDEGERRDEIPITTNQQPSPTADTTGADALRADDNEVEVRVSRKRPKVTEAPRKRNRSLAESLLDTVVDQLGEFIESSPAVQKLIRTQTVQVLKGLVQDPALAALSRAQAEQFLQELTNQPERLEPLVVTLGNRYLVYLREHPTQVTELIRAEAESSLQDARENPAALQALLRAQAGDYLTYLQSDPARIETLVRAQGERSFEHLQQDPAALEPVVRALGNRYIEYLHANPAEMAPLVQQFGAIFIDYLREQPDALRELIQGQSIRMTEQVMLDVRERAATSDTVLELFTRILLRRPPRNENIEPPPEVKQERQRTM
jgi:hypothetical protein